MLRQDVKIGMEVVMTDQYCGRLFAGQVFKIIRHQVADFFVVSHELNNPYLAPSCSDFEPTDPNLKSSKVLSAEEILGDFDFGPEADIEAIAKAMRIYRNQGIQQASEVCSEMLTDGFRISNIPAVLALKEEV